MRIACSIACAVALVPAVAAADGGAVVPAVAAPASGGPPAASPPAGAIDWQRRVLQATGRGAPDLNAPSIAVARLAAQRAATANALRNALDALASAPLDGGGTVGTLLAGDGALRTALEKKLRNLRAVRTRYFSDGGIVLEAELPLDELPAAIASRLKPPSGQPPK